MSDSRKTPLETAFDPQRFRREAHLVVDQLADWMSEALAAHGGPALPWMDPEELVAETKGFEEGPADVLEEVIETFLQRSLRLQDPRTMGHQDAVPLPVAILGGFVSGLVNNDPSVYETGPAVVGMETKILRWMMDEIGFPEGAAGILTSGGSLGNLTALLAARQAGAGFDIWNEGNTGGEPLCVLVSEEAHYCVARAAQVMGWGAAGTITVPVDDQLRLQANALPEALERARRAGRRPIAVVASACTTATSAFDPLPAIADFCQEHGLWFHVDGAHGACAALSTQYRHLVEGIDRADSVVWDGHKMMMVPSLVSAVLFRDGRRSYETFSQEATYLFEDRPDEEWYNSGNRTMECTKGGMAVRLYLALRTCGVGIFRDYVTHCFDQARRLAALISEADDFELAVEAQGNMVCFRHTPAGVTDLDALQRDLRQRALRDGRYYLTQAELKGKLHLRCSLMHPTAGEGELRGLLAHLRALAAA